MKKKQELIFEHPKITGVENHEINIACRVVDTQTNTLLQGHPTKLTYRVALILRRHYIRNVICLYIHSLHSKDE